MRQDASLEPGRLRVRRQFEAHRLAAACQARAYEQVVPGAAASRPADHEAVEADRGEAWEVAKGVAG